MASSPLTIPMMRLVDEKDDDRPHRNPYDLNSKIMLTAIISLSVIVVLVVILHTYARCVLRRQALRRATTLRRLSSTVAHAYSPTEPPKTGLEPSVIAALPVFVFKRLEGQERPESAANVECAVCLSMLEDEEIARLLPNCKHSFHAECIDTWLKSHTTCPICRTEAEPRPVLQPVPREGPAAGEVLPTAPPLESLTSATGGEAPTAPLLERVSSLLSCAEGTSHDGKSASNGSISKLSTSFRRILSRDRSSRRTQSSGQEDGIEDLERG